MLSLAVDQKAKNNKLAMLYQREKQPKPFEAAIAEITVSCYMTCLARIASLFALLTVVLYGCSQRGAPEYFLDQYTTRLSRVTDIEFSGPKLVVPALPPLRHRSYPTPDIRLKALEAIDLLKCPTLSQAIAYRNSSLGKQMLPSSHYFHEKALLKLIPECINTLQAKAQDNRHGKIINRLQKVLKEKQTGFPAIQWNLLFANTEISQQLSSPGRSLPVKGPSGFQGTREALAYLIRLLPDRTLAAPYTLDVLESHLQQVSASRYLGQQIYSATLLSQTLNHAASILEQRLHKGPVCQQGAHSDEQQRLYNVFRLFYQEQIQPYLSQIHQQGSAIELDWQQLLAQLPPAPTPVMTEYLQTLFGNDLLQRSITRHTDVWQAIFDQCGSLPGRH